MLATDNERLYVSDGTSQVRVLSLTDFRTERTFQVRESGRQAVREHDGVANGIALDSVRGRVLLTGKRWPRLVEIDVQDLDDRPHRTVRAPPTP